MLTFKATVIYTEPDGIHGPFAVAKVKDSRFNEQESVTFALTKKEVWADAKAPAQYPLSFCYRRRGRQSFSLDQAP